MKATSTTTANGHGSFLLIFNTLQGVDCTAALAHGSLRGLNVSHHVRLSRLWHTVFNLQAYSPSAGASRTDGYPFSTLKSGQESNLELGIRRKWLKAPDERSLALGFLYHALTMLLLFRHKNKTALAKEAFV